MSYVSSKIDNFHSVILIFSIFYIIYSKKPIFFVFVNINKILQLYFKYSKTHPNKIAFNWTRSNLVWFFFQEQIPTYPNCTLNTLYSHMITPTHILYECYTDKGISERSARVFTYHECRPPFSILYTLPNLFTSWFIA
jgi:hypothetical protein